MSAAFFERDVPSHSKNGAGRPRRFSREIEARSITSLRPCLSQGDPAILQLLTNLLKWDLGALWVVNDQRLVLECVEFYSPEESSVENFATVPRARRLCIGEGLPGTVCATRQVTELPSPFVRKGLGKGEPIRYLGRHENKDRRQTNRRYGT